MAEETTQNALNHIPLRARRLVTFQRTLHALAEHPLLHQIGS